MSDKEKSTTSGILDAISKLGEAKGQPYVSGLIDGINLGTAQAEPPKEKE